MRTLRTTLALTLACALAAPALAGDDEVKVKGMGSAKVRWNTVPYREELMQQLSPGLTWRLGSGGPTRLKLEKMALVGEGGVLMPGEVTLNLRFWSDDRWELVAFEDKDWKWSEESKERLLVPFVVGRHTDPKKAAKKLEIELRTLERKDRSTVMRPAVTGDGAESAEDFQTPTELTPPAQKQFDEGPLVEVEVRFGPHYGISWLEPVKTAVLKTKRDGAEGKEKLALTYPKYTDLLFRTEECEAEGSVLVGVLVKNGNEEDALLLEITGGDAPALWPVRRKGKEELDMIAGTRVPTKKTAKTFEVELDGGKLTVHLAKLDYVFELPAGL